MKSILILKLDATFKARLFVWELDNIMINLTKLGDSAHL